ncbi:MAG: hypothetical protein LM580_10785, partial [Thermofilum sp.]|nr:hypothetical protein [Thermofilum sp.]
MSLGSAGGRWRALWGHAKGEGAAHKKIYEYSAQRYGGEENMADRWAAEERVEKKYGRMELRDFLAMSRG